MNKEVFSKFTFGFLMAQFFPGVVTVSAVSMAVGVLGTEQAEENLWLFMGKAWEEMFTKPVMIPLYLFLAVGTGMLIHGLNWMVLAWLENHKNNENPKSVSESFWHGKLVVLQLLIGPIKMIVEVLWLLSAPGIDPLKMDENVARIEPKHMAKFNFLQEFYLYFGQFYAHTAYAMLFSIPCFVVILSHVGWTIGRGSLLVALYFAASVFFVIGRVQLTTLFKAERTLCDQSDTSDGDDPSRETDE